MDPVLPVDAVPWWVHSAAGAPMVLRVCIGVIGAVLSTFGHRVYRGALFGSAFALGTVGGVLAATAASSWIVGLARPEVLALVSVLCGATVAGVATMAHRIALMAVGGVAGIGLGVAVGDTMGGQALFVGPAAGAVIGALAFPLLFERMLAFLTPAAGIICIAWAVDQPANLWLLGGGWLIGVLLQLGPLKRKVDPG